ncbi:uncharacterized protein LOC113216914 isoform X2 [Frankliniella occidentalis]|uniref:Uncharacterized protein LOC113216914 isoform X2 n=1 Tax=Frankliniella occidentalis TaxID=133901 RepID=A0A9C6XC58_FRAOC|nr:uncharacterized protein LOC113216914 isoform X2 [Frankliniella occidentalis]
MGTAGVVVAEEQGDSLRELVADEEVECLLEALRKDFPHSVHIHNRIATQLRWRRQGDDQDVSIYRAADEGDRTEGPATAVSVWRVAGMTEVSVALHSTDPTLSALRRALRHSRHVPWHLPVNFESVHERCLPELMAAARQHGDPAPRLNATHKMFMTREAALKLDVSAVPGLVLRPLEPRHAKAVDDGWAYACPGSEGMFAAVLARNPGLSWGLFREEDAAVEDAAAGEPVALILGTWYGGLGILYTAASHRRRGLGELVTRAASRALAQRGLDVHCNIVYPNPASAATLAKVGFERVCDCTWLHYKPPPSSPPPSR